MNPAVTLKVSSRWGGGVCGGEEGPSSVREDTALRSDRPQTVPGNRSKRFRKVLEKRARQGENQVGTKQTVSESSGIPSITLPFK